ncbi:MAG TPA: hypothetical protein VEC56_09615 [Candidatus Krumholzibacteria bacterium]|nr:hypothetical protein [Candidatus Krumholzibacteria bacterium]
MTAAKRIYLAAFALGFIACGTVSVLMGQDNNWDLRNYHCYNAYAFLTDRLGFDYAPAQRQSYLNPFLDLPFYLGTIHLDPKLLGFLLGGIHGLSLGLLFAICMIVFRDHSAKARMVLSALCTGAGLYGPVFLGELGASQNDVLVGLFVLTALLLLVRTLAVQQSLAPRAARRALVVASLVFGAGAGLKATLMPHAVGLAVAACAVEHTWRNRALVLALACGPFLAGFLSSNGYWMLRLWQEFGNPVFPFYNDVFRSPWADPRSYADRSMIPLSMWDAVRLPFAFVRDSDYTSLQNGFRDTRYAALYGVLVVYAVLWLGRRFVPRRAGRIEWRAMAIESRFLLTFFVVSFVAWEAMFSIIRYTPTLELLAPLLLVVVGSHLLGHGVARTAVVATATLALLVATVKPIQHERLEWGETFWEIEVPPLPNPERTIVLIANARPLAYLIPAFPPEVRWLSLENNLTEPSDQTRMQADMRRLITGHDGDVYLLSRAEPSPLLAHDVAVAGYYGLRLESNTGLPIVSRHSPPGMFLWRLERY